MTLGLVEGFHAPGLAATGAVEHVHILRDAPVGADHAFELCLVAQLLLDEPFTIAATYILARGILIPEDAVDGHDGRGHLRTTFELEGSIDERALVHLAVVAWIDGILTRGVVGVATSLLGAVAIPVLHHRIDTLHAPALGLRGGLEGIAVGSCHIGSELGILAEGAAEARPSGIGGDIDLGREGCGDTQCTVLVGGNLAKAVHQLGIEGGSESE